MEIFAWGTFWFWTLIIIGFVVVTYLVEREESNGWGALGASILLTVALFFLGSREPIQKAFAYVVENPLATAMIVLGYFIAGTVWSIVKWYFHLKMLHRKGKWPTVYVDAPSGAFKDRILKAVAPKAKDNRSHILMWMSWWPFSALWTMVNDPVRKAFEWIFDSLEKTFDRISERVFKSSQEG